MSEIDKLISAASVARQSAHAPYSDHPVGAAVLSSNGKIYTGCNVENAAYPLGMCAEALAIGNMILAEHSSKIEAIVISGPGKHLCSPCGGCRQRIREFSDAKTAIYVCDNENTVLLETTLDELLPYSFGPENLEK
ncbi:cytidine deaminase [Kordiimonas sp. SCSIO 12610]|nr:cytidine deaminase [Kordiimonas sp. SCSIO 12610]UTW54833.1 cytidine deaminase [Kordiimonas sp. SCSIO 12610]